MGTYINNGRYVYGITEYDQPTVPYFNDTLYHKKPNIREFPCKKIKDDGFPYTQFAYPSCCATCNKCNAVNRNMIVNNFINIETYIDRILTVTLYATTKDKDETVRMKIGNKYCITYLTEQGLQTITGVFKEVSENVPDECLRYIGNFNSVTSAAYICLDCSTIGSSDKRLIYIASIRYIKEIFDEDDDPYANLTQQEKIIKAYSDIQTTISSINKYIEDNTSDGEEDNNSSDDNTQNNQQQNQPPLPPPNYPLSHPPYQGPIIIGAYPPPPPPPYYPIQPQQQNNTSESVLVNEDTLTALNNIKDMLKSFIDTYIAEETNKNTDDQNCNCNNTNNNDNQSTDDTSNSNNNSQTNDNNQSTDNTSDTDNAQIDNDNDGT